MGRLARRPSTCFVDGATGLTEATASEAGLGQASGNSAQIGETPDRDDPVLTA